jgi:hypothetical protein
MSRKALIRGVAGVAAVLVVGGVATYAWVDYSQAQNSLIRSRLDVRVLGKSLDLHPGDLAGIKPEQVAHLKEMYSLADSQVRWLEHLDSIWIDKGEISALRTALEKDKQDIDQLAAAVEKRRSSGEFGGWIHPSP